MKAILVIDEMPKECDGCPCLNYKLWYCQADKKRRDGGDDDRPEWCPLKPMPQRKIVGKIKEVDDFMKSDIQIINEKVITKIMLDTELLLACGYNLCIDEILGEEE